MAEKRDDQYMLQAIENTLPFFFYASLLHFALITRQQRGQKGKKKEY
jgi:hypothetical protein